MTENTNTVQSSNSALLAGLEGFRQNNLWYVAITTPCAVGRIFNSAERKAYNFYLSKDVPIWNAFLKLQPSGLEKITKDNIDKLVADYGGVEKLANNAGVKVNALKFLISLIKQDILAFGIADKKNVTKKLILPVESKKFTVNGVNLELPVLKSYSSSDPLLKTLKNELAEKGRIRKSDSDEELWNYLDRNNGTLTKKFVEKQGVEEKKLEKGYSEELLWQLGYSGPDALAVTADVNSLNNPPSADDMFVPSFDSALRPEVSSRMQRICANIISDEISRQSDKELFTKILYIILAGNEESKPPLMYGADGIRLAAQHASKAIENLDEEGKEKIEKYYYLLEKKDKKPLTREETGDTLAYVFFLVATLNPKNYSGLHFAADIVVSEAKKAASGYDPKTAELLQTLLPKDMAEQIQEKLQGGKKVKMDFVEVPQKSYIVSINVCLVGKGKNINEPKKEYLTPCAVEAAADEFVIKYQVGAITDFVALKALAKLMDDNNYNEQEKTLINKIVRGQGDVKELTEEEYQMLPDLGAKLKKTGRGQAAKAVACLYAEEFWASKNKDQALKKALENDYIILSAGRIRSEDANFLEQFAKDLRIGKYGITVIKSLNKIKDKADYNRAMDIFRGIGFALSQIDVTPKKVSVLKSLEPMDPIRLMSPDEDGAKDSDKQEVKFNGNNVFLQISDMKGMFFSKDGAYFSGEDIVGKYYELYEKEEKVRSEFNELGKSLDWESLDKSSQCMEKYGQLAAIRKERNKLLSYLSGNTVDLNFWSIFKEKFAGNIQNVNAIFSKFQWSMPFYGREEVLGKELIKKIQEDPIQFIDKTLKEDSKWDTLEPLPGERTETILAKMALTKLIFSVDVSGSRDENLNSPYIMAWNSIKMVLTSASERQPKVSFAPYLHFITMKDSIKDIGWEYLGKYTGASVLGKANTIEQEEVNRLREHVNKELLPKVNRDRALKEAVEEKINNHEIKGMKIDKDSKQIVLTEPELLEKVDLKNKKIELYDPGHEGDKSLRYLSQLVMDVLVAEGSLETDKVKNLPYSAALQKGMDKVFRGEPTVEIFQYEKTSQTLVSLDPKGNPVLDAISPPLPFYTMPAQFAALGLRAGKDTVDLVAAFAKGDLDEMGDILIGTPGGNGQDGLIYTMSQLWGSMAKYNLNPFVSPKKVYDDIENMVRNRKFDLGNASDATFWGIWGVFVVMTDYYLAKSAGRYVMGRSSIKMPTPLPLKPFEWLLGRSLVKIDGAMEKSGHGAEWRREQIGGKYEAFINEIRSVMHEKFGGLKDAKGIKEFIAVMDEGRGWISEKYLKVRSKANNGPLGKAYGKVNQLLINPAATGFKKYYTLEYLSWVFEKTGKMVNETEKYFDYNYAWNNGNIGKARREIAEELGVPEENITRKFAREVYGDDFRRTTPPLEQSGQADFIIDMNGKGAEAVFQDGDMTYKYYAPAVEDLAGKFANKDGVPVLKLNLDGVMTALPIGKINVVKGRKVSVNAYYNNDYRQLLAEVEVGNELLNSANGFDGIKNGIEVQAGTKLTKRKLITPESLPEANEMKVPEEVKGMVSKAQEVYEKGYKDLSAEGLKGKIAETKAKGLKGDALWIETIAQIKAAAKVQKGMTLAPQQLEAMVCGAKDYSFDKECSAGKTEIAAGINILRVQVKGQEVYSIVTNSYYAARDAAEASKLYNIFSISVGVNAEGKALKTEFKAKVVYTSLYDLMALNLNNRLSSFDERVPIGSKRARTTDEGEFHVLTQGKTPLIITGGLEKPVSISERKEWKNAANIANNWFSEEGSIYWKLGKDGIEFTPDGEKYLAEHNMNGTIGRSRLAKCLNALRRIANNEVYINYIGRKVIIIDQSMDRLLPSHRYENGEHKAMEAVKGFPIHEDFASIQSDTPLEFLFGGFENKEVSFLSGTMGIEKVRQFFKKLGIEVVLLEKNIPEVEFKGLQSAQKRLEEIKNGLVSGKYGIREVKGEKICPVKIIHDPSMKDDVLKYLDESDKTVKVNGEKVKISFSWKEVHDPLICADRAEKIEKILDLIKQEHNKSKPRPILVQVLGDTELGKEIQARLRNENIGKINLLTHENENDKTRAKVTSEAAEPGTITIASLNRADNIRAPQIIEIMCGIGGEEWTAGQAVARAPRDTDSGINYAVYSLDEPVIHQLDGNNDLLEKIRNGKASKEEIREFIKSAREQASSREIDACLRMYWASKNFEAQNRWFDRVGKRIEAAKTSLEVYRIFVEEFGSDKLLAENPVEELQIWKDIKADLKGDKAYSMLQGNKKGPYFEQLIDSFNKARENFRSRVRELVQANDERYLPEDVEPFKKLEANVNDVFNGMVKGLKANTNSIVSKISEVPVMNPAKTEVKFEEEKIAIKHESKYAVKFEDAGIRVISLNGAFSNFSDPAEVEKIAADLGNKYKVKMLALGEGVTFTDSSIEQLYEELGKNRVSGERALIMSNHDGNNINVIEVALDGKELKISNFEQAAKWAKNQNSPFWKLMNDESGSIGLRENKVANYIMDNDSTKTVAEMTKVEKVTSPVSPEEAKVEGDYLRSVKELARSLGVNEAELAGINSVEDLNRIIEKGKSPNLDPQAILKYFGTEEGIALLRSEQGEKLVRTLGETNNADYKTNRDEILKSGAFGVVVGMATLIGATKLADIMNIKDPYARFVFVLGLSHVANVTGQSIYKEGLDGTWEKVANTYREVAKVSGLEGRIGATTKILSKIDYAGFGINLIKGLGAMKIAGGIWDEAMDGVGFTPDSAMRTTGGFVVSFVAPTLAETGYSLYTNYLIKKLGAEGAEYASSRILLGFAGKALGWVGTASLLMDGAYSIIEDGYSKDVDRRIAGKYEEQVGISVGEHIEKILLPTMYNGQVANYPLGYVTNIKFNELAEDRKNSNAIRAYLSEYFVSQAISENGAGGFQIDKNKLFEISRHILRSEVKFEEIVVGTETLVDGFLGSTEAPKTVNEKNVYKFIIEYMGKNKIEDKNDKRIMGAVKKEFGLDDKQYAALIKKSEVKMIQDQIALLHFLDPESYVYAFAGAAPKDRLNNDIREIFKSNGILKEGMEERFTNLMVEIFKNGEIYRKMMDESNTARMYKLMSSIDKNGKVSGATEADIQLGLVNKYMTINTDGEYYFKAIRRQTEVLLGQYRKTRSPELKQWYAWRNNRVAQLRIEYLAKGAPGAVKKELIALCDEDFKWTNNDEVKKIVQLYKNNMKTDYELSRNLITTGLILRMVDVIKKEKAS